MALLFEKGSKIVCIGDSITDFERARPVGEGLFGAIGKSYVGIVDGLLRATDPTLHLRMINMGIGGNTSRDLAARWQTDVLDLAPDYVTVLIGINDVWRQFDSPEIVEDHVYPEEYRQTLSRLITETLPVVKGMVLMTPYMMEPNRQDPMRARMDEYGAIVKEIAAENHLPCIDLQAAFDEYFQEYHPASINWDRIHPNVAGHCIIARALLNGIGFAWRG